MPISPEMLTILAAGAAFYTSLVRVTARPERGGDVVAFALATYDVDYDGTTFIAADFEPSKMQRAAGVQADNATVTHLLAQQFSSGQLRGSKWEDAKLEMMVVDLMNLAAGPAARRVGRLGDVTTNSMQAESEFRGLAHLLGQDIGDLTSLTCRHKLGGFGCFLELAPYTFSGNVVSVTNNQKITVSVSKPNDYFKYGRAIWTSGLNDELEMEIVQNVGQVVTLFLPMPYAINIGDTLDLVAGDDRTLQTCHSKFNNAINHGGEDSMPRREDVYKFPD